MRKRHDERRTRAVLGRLACELSARQRALLACAVAAMLVASALASAVPVIVGRIVNVAIHSPTVTLGAVQGDVAMLAVALLVVQLLQVVRRQLVETVGTSVECDLRTRVHEHLLRLDVGYFSDRQTGAVNGRTNRSVDGATKLLKLGFMDLGPTVVLGTMAIAVVLARDPLVGALMFCVVPTGLALIRWQVLNQKGVREAIRDRKDELDGQVVEVLPAIETVRALNADSYFADRLRVASERLRVTELRHHKAMAWFDAAKSSNEAVWNVVVICLAVVLVGSGHFSAGEILTYTLLFNNVLAPLRELHRIFDEAFESTRQARDLHELLDEPIDMSYASKGGTNAAGSVVDPKAPALEMRDVHFGYQPDAAPVLDGVELIVEPGERIGLVGASGGGKTTMVRLIAGLVHGHCGTILLHGRQVDEYDRATMSEVVGYVGQTPFIFRGTVRENIAFGLDVDDEGIQEAARKAHLHDVITALPHGYDTVISERGQSLSGGQRQRLCIARQLLRRPRILLLDEPTAALDNGTEIAVQAAIDELDDVTVIEIAHRLTTLRHVDRIVVLAGGRIAESGSYAELAAAGGLFSAMLDQASLAPV